MDAKNLFRFEIQPYSNHLRSVHIFLLIAPLHDVLILRTTNICIFALITFPTLKWYRFLKCSHEEDINLLPRGYSVSRFGPNVLTPWYFQNIPYPHKVSEWVIKFNGLSRTADEVHIVHISRVILPPQRKDEMWLVWHSEASRKMAAILQTFWNVFYWMKNFVFWFKFHECVPRRPIDNKLVLVQWNHWC